MPILVNGIFKYPLKNSKWAPYVGAGVGGVFADLAVSSPGNSSSDSDFTFAYQGLAGIQYALTPHAALDLSYEFLGTLDHNWTINGTTLHSGDLLTHAVVLSFTWTF